LDNEVGADKKKLNAVLPKLVFGTTRVGERDFLLGDDYTNDDDTTMCEQIDN
jgi:hypothetical protein